MTTRQTPDSMREAKRKAVIAAMSPHGWLGEQCVTDILAALDSRVGDPDATGLRDFADRVMEAAADCCADPDAGPDSQSSVSFTGEEGARIANDLHRLIDSRAGDAGERSVELRARAIAQQVVPYEAHSPHVSVRQMDRRRVAKAAARLAISATPVPSVDAIPAGEVERLARIRTSMALLQQNSEGCAQNHYGDDATVHGMPGWLIDTKADLDAFTDILAALSHGEGRK